MARHALLIGVSRFADARLAALNAPADDVRALGAVLSDPERGGFASIAVSLDEDFMTVRKRLAALFDGRDPDDLLLLYYSGHGILGRGNRLFLATPDSDLDSPQVCSHSASDLREQMDQSRAERQVTVLDCCHSGAFAEGAKGTAPTAVTQDTFDTGAAGRYVLAAADALQFAWDGDSLKEGGASERKLSRFTSWLVDGLGRGEASPDDEQITMDELFRYVCRRARAEDSPATPQRYVDRGTGDLVIGRNPAAAGPGWQVLTAQLGDADWVVRDRAVEEVGRLSRKDGPAGQAARDALDERLTVERDFKVRNRIKELLGVAAQPAASPPPSPAPSADEAYELNDRERAVLTELTVPRESWGRLPAPVVERVRLYARALRNGRVLFWSAVVAGVFDVGAFANVQAHDPDAGAMMGAVLGQTVGGLLGVLPIPFLLRPVKAPVVPDYEGVMSRYNLVKWAGWQLYDANRLRVISGAMFIAGLCACVSVYVFRLG